MPKKRKRTVALAEAPSPPKDYLTVPRGKVSAKVGSKVKVIVSGVVVEENLGNEWEQPRKPKKRIEIHRVSSPRRRRKK